MVALSKSRRSWSDDQLRGAIAKSRSWRGVLRELGLNPTSSASLRVVRHHAERLEIDTAHFTGQRQWSDAQLKKAVKTSNSWGELVKTLGLASHSGTAKVTVKAHARRLGIDLGHLDQRSPDLGPVPNKSRAADPRRLREAAPAVAMAWFLLRGYAPALPVEPSRWVVV